MITVNILDRTAMNDQTKLHYMYDSASQSGDSQAVLYLVTILLLL
jgi:hypothetical protein